MISKSNQKSKKESINYSALLSNYEEILLTAGGDELKVYKTKYPKNGFRITDKNQLFFGKTNSIFIYNSDLRVLTEFTPSKTSDQLFLSEKFKNLILNNYTIQKLDQRNFHLIFTNTKSGNIEIRQLSK